jgi:hypothetical protein
MIRVRGSFDPGAQSPSRAEAPTEPVALRSALTLRTDPKGEAAIHWIPPGASLMRIGSDLTTIGELESAYGEGHGKRSA